MTHDYSGNASLCRNCGAGGNPSGSCRGWVPKCPACTATLTWGTASLYAYGNHGDRCPIRHDNVWISADGERFGSRL